MIAARSLLNALVGDAEIEALFSDEAEVAAMLEAEVALAAAEAEYGLISREAARDIARAAATFRPDWDALRQGMSRDGVIVPALVRQLRAAVDGRHAQDVHRGSTSQDIVDTGLMLRLKSAVRILEERLDGLASSLSALQERDGAKRVMAHTRMQVALPITVADKIATWTSPLLAAKACLQEIKPRLLVVQFGGPVGTRAGLDDRGAAIAGHMAATLELVVAAPWHADRRRIAEFGSWLSLLSGSLGKIGQDVALLAQNEISAVRLAHSGTSSAMTHKQNPVAAEVLVALGRYNAGLLGTLHQALIHENERSGAAWTLEWLTLPQMVVAAGAGLRTSMKLVEGLSFLAAGDYDHAT